MGTVEEKELIRISTNTHSVMWSPHNTMLQLLLKIKLENLKWKDQMTLELTLWNFSLPKILWDCVINTKLTYRKPNKELEFKQKNKLIMKKLRLFPNSIPMLTEMWFRLIQMIVSKLLCLLWPEREKLTNLRGHICKDQ